MIVTRSMSKGGDKSRDKSGEGHIIQSYIRSYLRELVNYQYTPNKSHDDFTVFGLIMEYLKVELNVKTQVGDIVTLVVHPFMTVQQLKEECAGDRECRTWTNRVTYNWRRYYIRERMIDIGVKDDTLIKIERCLQGPATTSCTLRKVNRDHRKLRKQGILYHKNVVMFPMEYYLGRIMIFSGRALTRSIIQKRKETEANGWIY
jgi:hypothetical protein